MIAFVGGGVGTITAALLLSHKQPDLKIDIFESSDRLGGRLTYEQSEDGQYRVDQGPTIVLLPQLLVEILGEAGVDAEELPLLECEPLYDVHYADGTSLRKFRDAAKQHQELSAKFGSATARAFTRFMNDMQQAYNLGKPAFLDRPFLRKRDFYRFRNVNLLIQLKAFKSARKLAASYFHNPKLIDAFSLQTLYIGGAPAKTPGLYSLVTYAEHAFGIYMMPGGYWKLVDVLAKALGSRPNINIHLRSPVDSIELDSSNNKVVAIHTQGQRLMYNKIIYNGDFPTINRLLPFHQAQERTYTPSSGCLLIYLGVNRTFPDRLAHQFYLPNSFELGMHQLSKEGRVPDEPSFYIFNPQAIDSTVAPEGKCVLYFLVPVPHTFGSYKEDVDALVDKVIAQAEQRGFEELRSTIEWQFIRTPRDAEASGLYGGGSFGIAPILMQSGRFRPQVKPFPEIEGLYAVGASVHPGGGIPIVMQGARLLVQQLLKELT